MQRATKLLQKMSLTEKLNYLHGPAGLPTECLDRTPMKPEYSALCAYTGNVAPNSRLMIPPLNMNDGPQGFRDPKALSTQYPSGLTVAASWDPLAVRSWGEAMGAEFFTKGANVQLGPGVCLARVAYDGRNFEYTSGEDPYLGAAMAGPAVEGIQSRKVIATVKHFVDNSQETARTTVTEVVDERTQFELYYPPFEAAAAAGSGAAMCSYNKIQTQGQPSGNWSCENAITLGQLRHELMFRGWVMSDWDATHSTSIGQGLDQEMPGASYMNPQALTGLIRSNVISEATVDAAVLRILNAMYEVGVMDEPLETWNATKRGLNATTAASVAAARQLAANSTVMLKNSGSILPLQPADDLKVAIIGLANSTVVTGGTGSGSVIPSYLVSPLEGISARLSQQPTFNDGREIGAAVTAAAAADVAVLFVGTVSGEGADRSSLSLRHPELANQDELVRAIAKAQPKTVVVVCSPGAVLMPWSADQGVAAVLMSFMPGQQFGNAIADIIFGDINPSGRLPVTMPNRENETDWVGAEWPGTVIPPSQGFCEPGTYSVHDLGCANASDARWIPSDNGGNKLNMTWTYAAEVCNAAGYSVAAVNGGDGAGIHCSNQKPPEAVLLPEGAEGYNKPYGYNLCNKTVCSGNRSQSCGGDGWEYNASVVRPTRVIGYSCTPRRTVRLLQSAQLDVVKLGAGGSNTQATYSEQLEVGYRYYDAKQLHFSTGFPFG